ncbi:MAG TPA: hypothetical protein VN154_11685 [Rhizomicrobium sp.]|nr:hypothetical protein [Rhizomicrobium sp.]
MLSACAGDRGDAPPPAPYMPVEFAMPAGTQIDRGDTTVVGDNLNWYGTLALTSATDMDGAHQFYAREMPREGWEPLSVLVADRVVLQFVNRRRARAAIVTIGSRTAVGGSHIEVVVSPLVSERSEVSETETPRRRPDY